MTTKKRIISLFLSLVMIISIFPITDLSVFAEEDVIEYLTYEINDGGVIITDCDESISGDVVIPDTIEGYPVTSIGDEAFEYCYSLTSITIPDSVTTIGNYAFEACDNLESVTIGDSVTTIGAYAFAYCYSLTNISVDVNNEYYSSDEYGVLFNKDKTELIQYPIGNSRTEYIIPDGVTTIGARAFVENFFIKSVLLPESVNCIKETAFAGCFALESISIPSGVTEISEDAFASCYSLESVILHNGITSIGDSSFSGCANLRSVNIPETVTDIGSYAFSSCLSLEKIMLPASVKTVGEYAFDYSLLLKNIYLYNPDIVLEKNSIPDRSGRFASIAIEDFVKVNAAFSVEYYQAFASGATEEELSEIYLKYEEFFLDEIEEIKSDIVIHSYSGSTAQTYAEEKEIFFVPFGDECEHLNTEHRDSVEATCVSEGFTGDLMCADCGEKFADGKVTPVLTSHAYGEWEVISEPSCTQAGFRTRKCAFCDATEETEIAATGHTDADSDDICDVCGESTCYVINAGETITVDVSGGVVTLVKFVPEVTGTYEFYSSSDYYVDTYGYLYDADMNELTHNDNYYDSNFLIKYTLTAGETYYFGCRYYNSSASGSFDVRLEALHEHNYIETVTPPTCTEQGYTTYTCSECGDSYISDYKDIIEHSYDLTVTPPTCTEQGYTTYICIYCGDTYTDNYINAIGHSFSTENEFCAKCGENLIAGLLTYTIENGEVTITDCSYRAVSVVIPETIEGYPVTTIGYEAFNDCYKLESITIPDSVTTIGESAFYGTAYYNNSYNWTNNVLYIGKHLIKVSSSSSNITIREGTKTIGDCAFEYCDSLTSITIPGSITSIGDEAFYHCDSLTSIFVDANNLNYSSDEYGVLFNKDKTELIQYPIGNSRTEYTIPNSVLYIIDKAFYSSTLLRNVTISNGVLSIGDGAFYSSGITNMIIPDSVTHIGVSAFGFCDNLSSFVYGKGITRITGSCFFYNGALKHITIPDTVTYIYDNAFYYCGLESINIPKNVSFIGDYAFGSINKITVDKENKYFKTDENGVLFNTDKTEIIVVPLGISGTEYSIPNTVTSIGASAFRCCRSLTSITIPDSVTTIGDSAFYCCDSLTNVTIGNSVTKIGAYAFAYCDSLTSITIPDSVTTIGYGAFYDCDSLTSITIPDSVTTIESHAFAYCFSLTDVYYAGNEEEWNKIRIEYDNEYLTNATIHFNSFGYVFTDSDFTQSHTVEDYQKNNKYYYAKYFSGTGMPMDGTSGNPDYCIPGLKKGEEMIPQGMTYYPEKDWILISAYNEPKDKGSVIFALDRETGNYVAQFNVLNGEGKSSTAHLGGIAVSDNNLYLSYNKKDKDTDQSLAAIGYIPLSELNVPIGTVKNIKVTGTKLLTSQLGDATTSYVTIADGVLYTGNFYAKNSSKYNTKASESGSSVVLGYQLSGSDSVTEWNNINADNPYFRYYLLDDNRISKIQSAVFKDGYLYMSCSYGRNNDSSLLVKYLGDERYGGFSAADFSCLTPPMMESLCFINDELYTLFESASYYYHKKPLFDESENPTDVIWRIDYKKLINKNTSTSDDIPTTTVRYNYGSVDISFKQNWFADDSLNYNHSLAQLSSQFVMLGYSQPDLKNALETIGMENIQMESVADENKVDYFIASRPVTCNNETYNLIFTGFIGTNTVQWYSNFDPGIGATHQSFNNAKNYILQKLETYVSENGFDESNTKILVCGHSRGAATANLVAADLIKNEQFAIKENIYTYAFATPNSTSLPERKGGEYKRIFNIVNPEDFVTKVLPSNWTYGGSNYGRYGLTYTLPSKNNSYDYSMYLKNMQIYFSQFTNGQKYTPFKNGEADTYHIVKKFTNNVLDVDDFYNKNINVNSIKKIKPYEFFKETICPLVAETNRLSISSLLSYLNFMNDLVNGDTDGIYNAFCMYFLQNAVLYEVNKMTLSSDSDTIKNVLESILGSDISTLLKTSENYFEDAHCAETYCAYMMSMSEEQVVAGEKRKSYKNTINCPVDVEVIDNTTGEVVARIVNNTIDEEIAAKENALVVSVDGDSKSVWIPSDGDYDVILTGNDDGTMDYTVTEVVENNDEICRVNFNDIEITKDSELSGVIDSENFVLDEYVLTSEDGDEISADDIITNENMDEFTFSADVTIQGCGSVSGAGSYTKSDYVTLTASTDEYNSFLGWYEDGELISTDDTIQFVIKENVSYTASFTNNFVCECGEEFSSENELYTHAENCCAVTGVHDYIEVVTDPTCTEGGYTTYTCECGNTYVDDETDALGHDWTALLVCNRCDLTKGDVNGDGFINSNDAIHLLYYSLIPDRYEINQNCDFDGDGYVNSNDAIYLLYHTLIPDRYPL